MHYRNAAHALVSELRNLTEYGTEINVRGRQTRELTSRVIRLENPTERCVTLPGRRNSIFAAAAETMWVLSGRNDLSFLTYYLERAPQFSDDGTTWRAGYGPRLRNWNGIDQVWEVLRLLTEDPQSRRAVIVLFDPDRDFVSSKDIPCNNWLHFLIREGQLDLNIAARSSDLIWGFSGINAFEWSVLHEMLAKWLNVKVGKCTYLMGSLHLYSEHTSQANKILHSFSGDTGYEKGWRPVSFDTGWTSFEGVLSDWFNIEFELRNGGDVQDRIATFPDPLLKQFLQLLQLRAMEIEGCSDEEVRTAIEALGHSDLAYAAHEHFFRNSVRLTVLDPGNREKPSYDVDKLRLAIINLHRQKSAGYGSSWKKRGEQIGIVANIDRKVDRLEMLSIGGVPGDETSLDTVIDLLIYCTKYQTYLADQDARLASQFFGAELTGPFSDDDRGFEALVSAMVFESPAEALDARQLVSRIVETSSELDASFGSSSHPTFSERADLVVRLTDEAKALLLRYASISPQALSEFVNEMAGER
jgi:thymidylate synthase